MLGSYGLNVRFQAILAEMTSVAWKAQKAELPEHVTSEEKDAMEAGMSRGYRKQLFGEIEKATAQLCPRHRDQPTPDVSPSPRSTAPQKPSNTAPDSSK